MKKLLLLFLMVTVAASVFADGFLEGNKYGNDDYQVYREEAAVILKSMDNAPIGEFTLKEIKELNLELSIPFQKMQFVKESKAASAIIPGMGQYMNNDPLGGTLFLVSNIAVITGTIIGAYYLLPDELKFDSLDYFHDSYFTINERWENQSFADMLPSMGIIAAGFVVDGIIRFISATHAGNLAQKNIAEGKIQFEPKLILPSLNSFGDNDFNHEGYGLGMRMSY
jgi:hypothetical protein